jgi:hypothetical protein
MLASNLGHHSLLEVDRVQSVVSRLKALSAIGKSFEIPQIDKQATAAGQVSMCGFDAPLHVRQSRQAKQAHFSDGLQGSVPSACGDE